jgi:cyanate permease
MDTMWGVLILWLGSFAVVALIAWWIHRQQRDVDGYYTRDYREPPVFQWHGPL